MPHGPRGRERVFPKRLAGGVHGVVVVRLRDLREGCAAPSSIRSKTYAENLAIRRNEWRSG